VLPRTGSPLRREGIRQPPADVPGGRRRALARIARSHTLSAMEGGIRFMAKKTAKSAKKKAAKKR
jgi:hypothetical protein